MLNAMRRESYKRLLYQNQFAQARFCLSLPRETVPPLLHYRSNKLAILHIGTCQHPVLGGRDAPGVARAVVVGHRTPKGEVVQHFVKSFSRRPNEDTARRLHVRRGQAKR